MTIFFFESGLFPRRQPRNQFPYATNMLFVVQSHESERNNPWGLVLVCTAADVDWILTPDPLPVSRECGLSMSFTNVLNAASASVFVMGRFWRSPRPGTLVVQAQVYHERTEAWVPERIEQSLQCFPGGWILSITEGINLC